MKLNKTTMNKLDKLAEQSGSGFVINNGETIRWCNGHVLIDLKESDIPASWNRQSRRYTHGIVDACENDPTKTVVEDYHANNTGPILDNVYQYDSYKTVLINGIDDLVPMVSPNGVTSFFNKGYMDLLERIFGGLLLIHSQSGEEANQKAHGIYNGENFVGLIMPVRPPKQNK